MGIILQHIRIVSVHAQKKGGKMTDRQADLFVLSKWMILSAIDYGRYRDYIPNKINAIIYFELPYKIIQFRHSCAWCNIYKYLNGKCKKKCPLVIIDECCKTKIDHPYDEWIKNPCRTNAEKVLSLCKRAIKKARGKK